MSFSIDSHRFEGIATSITSLFAGSSVRHGRKLRGAARAILRDGGLRAFWQGNGANVLKAVEEVGKRVLAEPMSRGRL